MSSAATFAPTQIVAKPTGWVCNIACTYCFYLEKQAFYPDKSDWSMSDEVLKAYVRHFIAAQDGPVATFVWQGGEPTLLGVDFYRRALTLQRQYAGTKRIENSLQTNGILLDDEWCEFLRENHFLVGVSIDGPREMHDRYRKNAAGSGTFDKVVRAIELLQRHRVEFNTLTTVHRGNADHPREVYRFLKSMGSRYLQFIPIVEPQRASASALVSIGQKHASHRASDESVGPGQYGEFLCAIFDEWVRNDVGSTFVQMFDVALQIWVGAGSSLCLFNETCGSAMALEHNGDVYSCDHYVYPENRLGNVLESPLRVLRESPQQVAFGLAKRDTLPQDCLDCDVRFACQGECPKNRFALASDGTPRLNYLCAGYKRFFRHIDPAMRFMAEELRHRRAPMNVMQWMRERDMAAVATTRPGRNDLCVCGSGKKFKKCCGR